MFKHPVFKITAMGIAVLFLDGYLVSAPLPSYGPQTPKSLRVTIRSAELATAYITPGYKIFDEPTTYDAIAMTGQKDSPFGSEILKKAEYKIIRMFMEPIGTYIGIDPCTGVDYAPSNENRPIVMPRSTPNDPDYGHIVRLIYEAPVAGTDPGKDSIVIPPFAVGNQPVDLRLVFPVTKSLICASSNVSYVIDGVASFLTGPQGLDRRKGAVGDDWLLVANSENDSILFFKIESSVPFKLEPDDRSPSYRIKGLQTELDKPVSVFMDTLNNEIYAANKDGNSITVYPDRVDPLLPLWNGFNNNTNIIKYSIKGSSTGLSEPSDVVVDLDEIFASNAADNSVTVYDRTILSSGPDISPDRTIRGGNTRLSVPGGIAVTSTEIAVANEGNNSVTFYNRADDGDVSPVRQLRGVKTQLDGPTGIWISDSEDKVYVSNNQSDEIAVFNKSEIINSAVPENNFTANVFPIYTIRDKGSNLSEPEHIYVDVADQLVIVANSGDDRITVHDLNDREVQLARLPMLVNSATQQKLYPRYFYKGIVMANAEGSNNSITFDGYHFVWQISDDRMRQEGDVSNDAYLKPPSDMVFTLKDGNEMGTLPFACKQFTPFSLLRLNTNCNNPKIQSPYPAPSGIYEIPATVLGIYSANKVTYIETPKDEAEFPRPIPTLTLGTTDSGGNSIEAIHWEYYLKGATVPAEPPLMIYSQQVIILLNKIFNEIENCNYILVQGQGANMGYNSGELSPDIRSLNSIKNNACPILVEDVESIQFVVKDALENNFVYDWDPN